MKLKRFSFREEATEGTRVFVFAEQSNKHEHERLVQTLTTQCANSLSLSLPLCLSFAQSINLITFVNVEIHEPYHHTLDFNTR